MNDRENPEKYYYRRKLQRGGEPILAGPVFRPKLFASEFGQEAYELFRKYANSIGNVSDEEVQAAKDAFHQKVGFDPDEIYIFTSFSDKIPVVEENEIVEQ